MSALKQRWIDNNQERVREIKSKYKKNNPEQVAIDNHRRRVRKLKSDGDYSQYEWNLLVEKQDGRCLACGKKTKLTVDHVVPLSKGGSNYISNIQGLCMKCNASKHDKIKDYRKQTGLLRWIQKRLFPA